MPLKMSETLETYACIMHFHHNISRLRVAAATASIVTTIFYWATTASAAPQQHLGARGGRGTVHSSRARAGEGARCVDGGGAAQDGARWMVGEPRGVGLGVWRRRR